MKRFFLCLGCSLLLFGRAAADEPVDYDRDIKPLFAGHCTGCHGAAKQRSGLRLDTAALALKGGNEGPVIAPSKSSASKLIQAVTGADGAPQMPPESKPRLTPRQIALLKAWIDQGAKAPAGEIAQVATRSKHWSFQPPKASPPPAVRNQAWVRNPIDRFILSRLEKERITPSLEADRVTLIRRLSLDLLGLPPSTAEVDAFVSDKRPDAYDRLVDRLLASPHYGERWGRHWLDLARYADSNGFNIDAPRTAWPYRDWVIDAFNRDLPFDRFTIEQIAGDLLPGASREQLVATGFHRNTLLNQEGGIDHEQFRIESVVDRVNTTGAVFLGLTLGCAQCHDHKYDPFSQREYYQMFAFLNNADEPTLPLPTPREQQKAREIEGRMARLKETLRGLDDLLTAKQQAAWERGLTTQDRQLIPAAVKALLDVPDYQRSEKEKDDLAAALRKADQARQVAAGFGQPLLPVGTLAATSVAGQLHLAAFRDDIEKKLAALQRQMPRPTSTLIFRERAQPRETHVHIKGDFLRKGARVSGDVPAVLPPLPQHNGRATRLDLARWLVDPHNPLTARVTVNRVWQRYFGTGLVETENDFGLQGTPPSHPALLDWLACEFVKRGWSLKAVHRLIVTSAAYRQASNARPDLALKDPRNRLLARQNRLRLEAEIVRDVGLSASGLLSTRLGGPTVFPPQPAGVFVFTQVPRDWKPSTGPDRYRRGLYTHYWRSAPHPALTVFDAPESTATCTRRNRSNTPLQALTLLNDQAFVELARGLAARVLREADTDDVRIGRAFRLCLARPPRPFERQRLVELLADLRADFARSPKEAHALVSDAPNAAERAAWTMVARALLNLDEFITRE
jgi:mono/diheme cytochrome c family protein